MSDVKKLHELPPGHKASIVKIEGSSPFRKRLMEMGLVKGVQIEKVKLAPLADPAEYIIKGYHISLRNEEARDIVITMTSE